MRPAPLEPLGGEEAGILPCAIPLIFFLSYIPSHFHSCGSTKSVGFSYTEICYKYHSFQIKDTLAASLFWPHHFVSRFSSAL